MKMLIKSFTIYSFIFFVISSNTGFAVTAKKGNPKLVAKVQQKSKAMGVAQRRGPASDPNTPIEVRGQSRNLNMMLILQNQNEVIDFIKLRKDYQTETKKMNY